MARFRADEAENYGGSGGGGFFSLKNDKDVARVRFMYNTIDDVEGFAVHQVEIDGKKRWVNCLRDYRDPVDVCPFCRERKPQYAKLFIPLYNIDDDKIQLWERGKKFFAKISSICSRYASKDDLVSHIFEIERNGKAGDQQTTYEIYEVDKDDTTLEDLPEMQDILGNFVLDKTVDDMEFFIDEGSFPPEDNEPPMRGGRVGRNDNSRRREEEPRRRTSATRRERDDVERDDDPQVLRRSARRTPPRDEEESKEF